MVNPSDTDPPYLVIDPLGQELPDGRFMQKSVRAILERKYGDMCDPAYVDKVVKSFPLSGISVRDSKAKHSQALSKGLTTRPTVALFANEGHSIHHVREHGYVESPVRIRAILKEMSKLDFVLQKPSTQWPDKHIQGVHDADYMAFLKRACLSVEKGKSVHPYVFPIRNQDRKPLDTPLLAGYYCIDTFTPLNADAYQAARTAVDCALSAAEELISGVHKMAYALVRPPGHHAERKSFGGFCYFANTAIAAHHLSHYGKVAILDVDYHHGNSQQDIFYSRDDVLTLSLHGDPKFAYPYFTGFADEMGEGRGYGFNHNIPLPEHLTPGDYLKHIGKALKRIREFNPSFLVVALGLDTAKADPTGTWGLLANDFAQLGALLGQLQLPTLVVQEGGYRTRTLGINARHFFTGLNATHTLPKAQRTRPGVRAPQQVETRIRSSVRLSDVDVVRNLVAKTKVFSDEEVTVAGELVAEAALKGEARSGYSFCFFEEAGVVIGYSCFGRVPLTESSFDLYWLVVDPQAHKRGIAQRLQVYTEQAISVQGGTQMYAETSSTDKYQSARSFYLKAGFIECARQTDFYRVGDDKVTYVKKRLTEHMRLGAPQSELI